MAFNKKIEEPFHSGEVFHLWNYLYNSKNLLVTMQVFINHTGDADLQAFLEDFFENCLEQEEQQIESILKESGIRLPPAPPDRPNVELEDIPAGARFNDAEIAILVKREIVAGRMECSYMTQLVHRIDLRSMLSEFYAQKEEYEQKLFDLSKEKGWIVPPPINIK